MRDIYVRATGAMGGHATPTVPATPGYHASGPYFVYRILDVPETVSEALAVFTFNQCSVLGHTVLFRQLQKGQPVRGEGLAWEPALVEVL